MTNNEQIECSTCTREELIERVSTMLIDYWPLMRKRLVHINALQAEFAMPASHIQLLAMLSHEESLSISQISERFEIAKPNITPMVDRMISEGLVMRVRSNQDKRIVSVVICDKGRECLQRICESSKRVLTQWAHDLTDQDVQDFYTSLATIIRLLNRN